MADPVAPVAPPPTTEKPAAFRDTRFVVEEGWSYRAFSKGAIWMNKLWLSALVLLAVWLLLGGLSHQSACATTPQLGSSGNGTVDQGTKATCSVFLSPTSLYLGSMAIVAFVLQVAMGLLGNMVGRKILEATPAADEVGAGASVQPTEGPSQGRT